MTELERPQEPDSAEHAPVALVTGGGAGIGEAVSTRLAAHGYRVLVVDIDLDAAKKVADAVGGVAFQADVADPAQHPAMAAHAIAQYGRLDLAVLNAGVSSGQAPELPLDVDKYRRTTGVNLDSVVYGIDAVTGPLAESGGAIVVTASLAGLDPTQANPIYAMTKSAVLGYVRAMSVPLAKRGVTINAICPGFVDTAMLGISVRLLRRQGFPLLSVDEVADAVLTVLAGSGTGEAWTLLPGRPPAPFGFPPVPSALLPDGSEAQLKGLLGPRAPKKPGGQTAATTV
jgi:NAD(P)-dependent dehydrogenase (short-subunit alcohol dehydrogenase family)